MKPRYKLLIAVTIAATTGYAAGTLWRLASLSLEDFLCIVAATALGGILLLLSQIAAEYRLMRRRDNLGESVRNLLKKNGGLK